MAFDNELIAAAGARLERERDLYAKLAKQVAEACDDVIRAHHIPATVQWRVKSSASLEGKLRRYLRDPAGGKCDTIGTVDDVFAQVGDLAGVRVATYVERDRDRVAEILRDRLRVIQVERHAKPSGYRATHCQVQVSATVVARAEYSNLSGLSCEVQVCSMLAHVWNEIEHSVRYKLEGVTGVDAMEAASLNSLLKTVEAGDSNIRALLTARHDRMAISMVQEIVDLLSGVPRFGTNARDAVRLAIELGYTTPAQVAELVISSGGPGGVAARIATANDLMARDGVDDLLDPETGDVLLVALVEKHGTDVCVIARHDTSGTEPQRVSAVLEYLVPDFDLL